MWTSDNGKKALRREKFYRLRSILGVGSLKRVHLVSDTMETSDKDELQAEPIVDWDESNDRHM